MELAAGKAFEEICKLLEAASTDPSISVEDYRELLEEVADHCEMGVEDIDDEEELEEAEEDEDDEEDEEDE
jgi:hypothetical protein